MKQKVDERVKKTKSSIKDAFFELAAEVGYAKVNVTNIIKKANINRNTFYSHYESKDDLLYKLELEIVRKFQKLVENAPIQELIESKEDSEVLNEYALKLATLIYEERNNLSVLLNDMQGTNFHSVLRDMVSTVWKKYDIENHYLIPPNYVVTIQTNIILSLIKEWSDTSFKETPEEFSAILKTVLFNTNIYIEKKTID